MASVTSIRISTCTMQQTVVPHNTTYSPKCMLHVQSGQNTTNQKLRVQRFAKQTK